MVECLLRSMTPWQVRLKNWTTNPRLPTNTVKKLSMRRALTSYNKEIYGKEMPPSRLLSDTVAGRLNFRSQNLEGY